MSLKLIVQTLNDKVKNMRTLGEEAYPLKTTNVTVGIPVSNLTRARQWYEALLKRNNPDLEPVDSIAEYQVSSTTWLQLYEGPVNPNDWIFRFGVSDIHAERSRLLEMGIAVSEVEEVPGVVAFCDFDDPDGNQLSLYTVLADTNKVVERGGRFWESGAG